MSQMKEYSEVIPSIATGWVLLQLAWCVFASQFFPSVFAVGHAGECSKLTWGPASRIGEMELSR